MSKILVIEDDKTKIARLKAYLNTDAVTFKESFQSGLLELKNYHSEYDALILDMTIPLWEKGNNDLGGNYEQFGGERILREMKRRNISVPTILFTMFDIFPYKGGNITFDQLNEIFKDEFSPFYRGAVFYNSNEELWKVELKQLMSDI